MKGCSIDPKNLLQREWCLEFCWWQSWKRLEEFRTPSFRCNSLSVGDCCAEVNQVVASMFPVERMGCYSPIPVWYERWVQLLARNWSTKGGRKKRKTWAEKIWQHLRNCWVLIIYGPISHREGFGAGNDDSDDHVAVAIWSDPMRRPCDQCGDSNWHWRLLPMEDTHVCGNDLVIAFPSAGTGGTTRRECGKHKRSQNWNKSPNLMIQIPQNYGDRSNKNNI